MSTSQTTNLHLVKPDDSEYPDVSVINGNMDTIDAKMGAVGNTSLQEQIAKFKLLGSSAVASFDIWSTGFQVGVYSDSSMQNGFLMNVETSDSKIHVFTLTNGTPVQSFEK